MSSRVGPKRRTFKYVFVAMSMTVALVAGLLPASPASAQEPDYPEGTLPPGDWSPSQVQDMLDLIADAEEKLPAFDANDTAALESMGFVNIGVLSGGYEHWVNVGWFADEHVLDPEYAESLVVRRTAAGREVVAAMLFLDAGTTMDDIPDDVRWLPGWHTHPELCSDDQGRILWFTIPGTNSCPAGSAPADGPPMMHVWLEDPGCGHRFGGLGVGGLHCDDHGDPGGYDPGSGYPSGGHGEATADGAVAVDSVPTGFGPGGPVEFPTGGEGVCNPDGAPTTLTAMFGEDGSLVPVTQVETTAQPADLVVTDDGAICGEVSLSASGGEIDAENGTFGLSGVTAEVAITGTGVFEPLIPAGCSLTLDVGELSGTIDGDGPPNASTLSASDSSVAEAPDSCGGYGQLLDVGFDLPSTNAEIGLDLSIDWGGEDHDDH